jgi:hypothetical protein
LSPPTTVVFHTWGCVGVKSPEAAGVSEAGAAVDVAAGAVRVGVALAAGGAVRVGVSVAGTSVRVADGGAGEAVAEAGGWVREAGGKLAVLVAVGGTGVLAAGWPPQALMTAIDNSQASGTNTLAIVRGTKGVKRGSSLHDHRAARGL